LGILENPEKSGKSRKIRFFEIFGKNPGNMNTFSCHSILRIFSFDRGWEF